MAHGAADAGTLSERTRFKRALTLLAMSIIPGTAQIAAGDKRVGRAAWRTLFVIIVLLVATAVGLLFLRTWTLNLLARPGVLLAIAVALVLVALGWAFLFIDAFRLSRPGRLNAAHRGVTGVLTTALVVVVVGALGLGANLVNAQRGLISSVFSGTQKHEAVSGRYNVLLLGGDAGKDRTGLRPDSLTVASIDADTGRTVLIGLPRNTQKVPFPAGTVMHQKFPNGFSNCGYPECMLNGINTWATDHKSLFPGVKEPGLEATAQGVEALTGLKINYYVVVDLGGFKDLVDAVGGVYMNVYQRVPIGGIGSPIVGYIEPGKHKHLTGWQALWFARSRVSANDYQRMARQKCVMVAMLNQLDPVTVLTKFNGIAAAGKRIMATSIPSSQVGTFTDLALKAKKYPVSSFSAQPPLVNTASPNVAVIHSHVAATINKSEAQDHKGPLANAKPSKAASKSSASPSHKASSTPRPSSSSSPQQNASSNSSNVSAAC